MKTQILKSIFLFCILHFAPARQFIMALVLAGGFCISSNAQIVYTDVNPDLTSTGAYNLDLNNDGINDFVIKHTSSLAIGLFCPGGTRTNNAVRVTPLGSNQVLDTIYSAVNYSRKLLLNTVIDSSTLTWKNDSNQIIRTSTFSCFGGAGGYHWVNSTSGYWLGSTDGYLGLKLIFSGNTYFGWLRMSVPSTAISFALKDYAYNSVPNQFILAGDTGTTTTGIIHNNFQANSLSVYPNPGTNSVTIKFPSDKAGEIKIVNLFGQIVFSVPIKIGTEEKTIDINKFSAGMYVARWSSGENFGTKIFSVIK
ncbi:MAG: T9SS type A sorting domain-containing protein [Bacteroidia bacterium]